MDVQPIYIGGQWRQSNYLDVFQATNPRTGAKLPDYFPISGWEDLREALEKALQVVPELASSGPEKIAGFLEKFAQLIEEKKDIISQIASLETGLPQKPRFSDVELPRTTDQLRQAAAVVREKSWCQATIDTKKNIRSKYGPLGGAIYHFRPEDGLKAIAHPAIAAVGFTGSRSTGLAIKEAAEKAGKLAYLEMSSINPVFLLPGAIQERAEAIAQEFFSSCLLGNGQFCTNPGFVILLEGKETQEFINRCVKLFQASDPGYLLSEQIKINLAKGIKDCLASGAQLLCGGYPLEGPGFRFAPTLLLVQGEIYLPKPQVFQREMFGPVSLLVLGQDEEQVAKIAISLEGNLTTSFYTHSQGKDEALYQQLEPIIRLKVGRLLNDKMPTGVAVTPAMMHGGPYPATGHPGFSSVGFPASILRFAARHGYDQVPQHRLPPELQDKNPTGHMWRYIDGQWTQTSITKD